MLLQLGERVTSCIAFANNFKYLEGASFLFAIVKNHEKRDEVLWKWDGQSRVVTVVVTINVKQTIRTNIKQITANYSGDRSIPTTSYVGQVYGDVIVSIGTGLFMPETKSVS